MSICPSTHSKGRMAAVRPHRWDTPPGPRAEVSRPKAPLSPCMCTPPGLAVTPYPPQGRAIPLRPAPPPRGTVFWEGRGAHRRDLLDKLVHVGHGGLVVLPSKLLAVQSHEVRLVRVHDLGREAQDRPSEAPRIGGCLPKCTIAEAGPTPVV